MPLIAGGHAGSSVQFGENYFVWVSKLPEAKPTQPEAVAKQRLLGRLLNCGSRGCLKKEAGVFR